MSKNMKFSALKDQMKACETAKSTKTPTVKADNKENTTTKMGLLDTSNFYILDVKKRQVWTMLKKNVKYSLKKNEVFTKFF